MSTNVCARCAACASSLLSVLPWLVLVAATIVMASLGPVFKWIMVEFSVQPALASVWRNQTIILFLSVPALVEWARATREERAQWWAPIAVSNADDTPSPVASSETRPIEPVPTRHVAWYMLAICLNWTLNLFLFIMSLTFTTSVRSTLFANLSPIFLMLHARLVVGVRHSRPELAAALAAIVGVFLALLDESPEQRESVRNPLVGDLMGVGVSAFVAVNILNISKVRRQVPVFVFTFSALCLQTSMMTVLSMSFEGSSLFGSGSSAVFGWLNPPHATRSVMLFGFVVGVLGMIGQNFSLRHVPPVMFSVILLMGPPITALMVWLAALEAVPKRFTLIGGGITLAGIVGLVLGEHRRKEAERMEKEELASASATATASASASAAAADPVELHAIEDGPWPAPAHANENGDARETDWATDLAEFAHHDFRVHGHVQGR